jgi:hypothetical protein
MEQSQQQYTSSAIILGQTIVKNILTSTGIALLGILGTQQVIINSHQMRVNGFEARCMDEQRDKHWWGQKNEEETTGIVNRFCRGTN